MKIMTCLTGFLASLMFVPFTSQAVMDEPLIQKEDLEKEFEVRKNPFLSKRKTEELRNQVIKAFTKLNIDFHDIALQVMYTDTFPVTSNILFDDALGISVLLSPTENVDGLEVAQLLYNIMNAGIAYVILTPDFCNTPNNRNQLASQWQNTSLVLANFLAARTSSPRLSEKIRQLFLAWTESQIRSIDLAAPQCADPSSPVDAAASNEAYKQTRALTFLVAELVFDVLHK